VIIVIIAGGSGTRLWPLSTHDYPKHLLKLTSDRSLLQNTYDRVSNLSEDILVVTERSHVEHVYDQLPEIDKKNILIEPARKGTASCIILALAEIKKRKFDDQPVFFLWADHIIRDKSAFGSAIKQGGKLAEAEQKLVFFGIEPTYPSTGFGYMHKGQQLSNGYKNVYELEKFVEKPDRQTAEEYMDSGEYLWNTGYMMGTISTFERELEKYSPRVWGDYNKLLETKKVDDVYMKFEPEAIDYALSEHVEDGLVVPGSFDWGDVGSFNDLHRISRHDNADNYTNGADIELDSVTNSYIRNEQNLPVAVIGLDNVAVIATKNGILVTNKNYSQKVGDIAKKLQKSGK
jgi:mannose-1-phosphate guanylyltransferase/mannose-6-phosphate isomerase